MGRLKVLPPDPKPSTSASSASLTSCTTKDVPTSSSTSSSSQSVVILPSSGMNRISCGPSTTMRCGSATTTNNNSHVQECPLCLAELPSECFPDMSSCHHRACYDCLQKYLKIEISESRVLVTCPECSEMMHPNDIRMVLNDEGFLFKYEKFMLRRVLVAEPDARWCPAPDCGFVVIASGCAGCPKLQCHRPGCNTNFCYHCKAEWHPNQTCDAARQQRARHNRRGSSAAMDAIDVLTGQPRHHRDQDIKPCPTCKVLIIKMDDGSCNHMTCSVCGTEFCWLCMKQINDLHYLSPSGCTFWGKKPWSRKKKIMWQLGMLVGAPVGIALIAGIAVPAIIIGIPVWVGRKLHARFSQKENSNSQKKNKNLLVATGVIASVAVSPVLALVAVGIGIPILLAYVYGVVPISLCRSGGCGVESDLYRDLHLGDSTDGSRNVDAESGDFNRKQKKSDRDATSNTTGDADGVSVDTALSGRKTGNPSIGEVSLGMSTSFSMTGSGYHLDRSERDRESASNAPLNGSIASASHRLEVATDKRSSFSSETASACGVSVLSERMSTDDGTSSTRGLAGSIISRLRGHRNNKDTTSDAGSDLYVEGKTPTKAMTPVDVYVQIDDEDSRRSSSSTGHDRSRRKSSGGGHHHTVITIPARDINHHQQGQPSTSRCVSFQPVVKGSADGPTSLTMTSTSPASVSLWNSPVKSRSLEHLSIFCDYCNSSHRPCCPKNAVSYRGQPTPSKKPPTKSSRSVEEAPPPLTPAVVVASSGTPSYRRSLTRSILMSLMRSRESGQASAATTTFTRKSSRKTSSDLGSSASTSGPSKGLPAKKSNLKRVKSNDTP